MSKRTIVDQKMCDMVRMMMAGKPKIKTVADMLGVGASTIQRIQAAGFDAQKYKQLTGERKAKERQDKEPALVGNYFTKDITKFMPPTGEQLEAALAHGTEKEANQLPGQIKMFFPEGGGAPVQIYDQDKMIRFLAGKIELLSGWMEGITEKLDKIIDYQAQQLRRMDK